jgi:predicted nucleic acid-binding protein
MMNLVDSSGWLEFLTKGKNGPQFLALIRDTQNLLVPTIVLYEVVKRVALLMGEETIMEIAGLMLSGQEVVLDRSIAIEAARTSLELKLPMADSIILATARAYDATLWTQDAHFKDIEGVRYIEKGN